MSVVVNATEPASAAAPISGTTRTLAEYIVSLRYENLPATVVEKTKLLIRDGLGNQLAASSMQGPSHAVLELLREWGGKAEATVVGHGDRLPAPHAAMVNAMMGHGVELDDAHGNALTKSGSALIPATMVMAERENANGRAAITAAVAGYDTMVRIGLAINPAHRQRGYHTTGTVSPFGVAAIASKLLNLNVEQTQWALGLAGMQSAGVQAFLDDPCMAKPFSPGKGAFNGVLAAILASRGFSGPRMILESREGFLNAFAGTYDASRITDGLGSDFKIMEVAFKPHAACRYAHGPIDAAQTIRRRDAPDPAQIESIIVHCCELAIRQSGRVEAPNLNSAMGSTPYGVALAFLRGANGLPDYRESFDEGAAQDLARKVTMVADPEMGVMGRAAVVEVKLHDGGTLTERVGGPKGEPELPLSADELRDKFVGLATMGVGRERAEQLIAELDRLETLEDLSGLRTLLVRS